jgi:hypothetical protein
MDCGLRIAHCALNCRASMPDAKFASELNVERWTLSVGRLLSHLV